MQGDLGTPDAPLRVAIIGSGPSGFYAAEHLQEQDHLEVQIDMYDRLPTPFGLVRGGVAPSAVPGAAAPNSPRRSTGTSPTAAFWLNCSTRT